MKNILLFVLYANVASTLFVLLPAYTTPFLLMWLVIVAVLGRVMYQYRNRGIFGKKGPSPEAKKQLEEKNLRREGLKAEYADMVAKQHELESLEKQNKEKNEAADFVDIVKRPGKYSAVEKYRVGYLVERGDDDPLLTFSTSPEEDVEARMTPRARPINDVVFFNNNYVKVEGKLVSCTESVGEYFGRDEKSGYNLRRGQLVHLILHVKNADIDQKVTVVCSRAKQPAVESTNGGYKRVNLSLTAELLGFEIEIGQRIRVNGDMWKRLKPSAFGESAGYYMQTSLHNIKLLTETR